jgi:hypothetical protein
MGRIEVVIKLQVGEFNLGEVLTNIDEYGEEPNNNLPQEEIRKEITELKLKMI